MLYKKFLPLIIPISVIEAFSIIFEKYYLGIIILPVMFVWIYHCKLCKRYESIWLFIISSIVLIPYDVILVINIYDWMLIGLEPVYVQIPAVTVIAVNLLCIEQLIIGVMGRIIWKKQRSVKMI